MKMFNTLFFLAFSVSVAQAAGDKPPASKPSVDTPSGAGSTSPIGASIEPYLGYTWGMSNASATGVSGSDLAGTYSGLGLGGRLGGHFLQYFFAGLDVSYYPSVNFSQNKDTLSPVAQSIGRSLAIAKSRSSLKAGLFAGATLPTIPLSFWLGYNFIDNLALSVDSASSTVNGSSLKFGLGYTVISYCKLSVEYIMTSFSSATVEGTTTKFSTLNPPVNFGNTSVFISLGVPIRFLK